MKDNYLIGDVVTRFWLGEKFKFTYHGNGEWSCDKKLIPYDVKKEFIK